MIKQCAPALALAVGAAFYPAPAPSHAPESAPAPGARPAIDEPFDAPADSLRISADAVGEMTLHDLMVEFASVTGEQIHVAKFTRDLLQDTSIGLLGAVTVPPGEVYTFVENLLFQNRFVVADLRRDEPRMLGIYSLTPVSDREPVSGWRTVDERDLGVYADHPALLVQVTLDTGPLEPIGIVTSMRSLFFDAAYQRVMHTGSGPSVVVRGTGREVADFAGMIASAIEDAEN